MSLCATIAQHNSSSMYVTLKRIAYCSSLTSQLHQYVQVRVLELQQYCLFDKVRATVFLHGSLFAAV
jgi:hypothetical protein